MKHTFLSNILFTALLCCLALGFNACKDEEIPRPDGEVVTLAQILTRQYEGKYVRIDNVQFAAADTAKLFYTAAEGSGSNRSLTDCDGNSVIVRTASNAPFASTRIPDGKGTIRARVSSFGTTVQLVFVDTQGFADISNDPSTRCFPGQNATLTNISAIRSQFSGTTTNVSGNVKIRGVVISDRSTANLNGQNVYIQDASAGILVRFTAAHNLNLGEQVEIFVQGQELSTFNGLLQLNNVPSANVISRSPGTLPAPQVITISQFTSNYAQYEAELVQIQNVQFSPATGTFSGSKNISDGTNTLTVFTSSAASFASTNVPTGCQNITGIATTFNTTRQLSLRNPTTDLAAATGCTGGGGGGGATLNTIAQVRALTAGTITANIKISGTVTSDWAANNVNGGTQNKQNFVIQDATAGITLRLVNAVTGDFPYVPGDVVEINLQNTTLGLFSGLLQISNIPASNITKTGTAALPEFQTVTIDQLTGANAADFESELVRVENVKFTTTGTYAGNQTLVRDGTSTPTLTCRVNNNSTTPATFASTALPTTVGTIRGIAGISGTTRQIQPRNSSDLLQ